MKSNVVVMCNDVEAELSLGTGLKEAKHAEKPL